MVIKKIKRVYPTVSDPLTAVVTMLGKSSEVSSLPDYAEGSSFFAYDTGETYYFDGENWAIPTPPEGE